MGTEVIYHEDGSKETIEHPDTVKPSPPPVTTKQEILDLIAQLKAKADQLP